MRAVSLPANFARQRNCTAFHDQERTMQKEWRLAAVEAADAAFHGRWKDGEFPATKAHTRQPATRERRMGAMPFERGPTSSRVESEVNRRFHDKRSRRQIAAYLADRSAGIRRTQPASSGALERQCPAAVGARAPRLQQANHLIADVRRDDASGALSRKGELTHLQVGAARISAERCVAAAVRSSLLRRQKRRLDP